MPCRSASDPRPQPAVSPKGRVATAVLLLACLHANPTRVANASVARERHDSNTQADVVRRSDASDAMPAAHTRGAATSLVVNGGFSDQPNPLAFWTNAPGAFVTWVSDGANGSQGSAQVRFFPPVSTAISARGAVFYTGLTQCVSIPRPGRYLLSAFARVPVGASPSSLAGLGWTLRANGPNCTGPADSSGRVGSVRSTEWTATSVASIEIDAANWTVATTIEVAVQVGDSSTNSIEPVEGFVDEIALIEGPLFKDGFEN
jgi:hypothetical protein